MMLHVNCVELQRKINHTNFKSNPLLKNWRIDCQLKRATKKSNLNQNSAHQKISVKPYSTSSKKMIFFCKMKQIPANSNDATMGHKLQGMSKDVIVVMSWPTWGLAAMFKNWEYVVLSRVRTLSGLYLVEPIDKEKLFKPSSELKK